MTDIRKTSEYTDLYSAIGLATSPEEIQEVIRENKEWIDSHPFFWRIVRSSLKRARGIERMKKYYTELIYQN